MIDYQKDFYGWTQEQAALLKAGRLDELDVSNLAEELEAMGRSEKRELEHRLIVLLIHLLKWRYQPSRRGNSWRLTIEEQRLEVFDVLSDNPGLKPRLDELFHSAYKKARLRAANETGLDKTDFPSTCPWSIAGVLDDEYWPD